MINEERVKELFQVALYDQCDDVMHDQVKSYFKSDYIGKEMIKSFFSGTFAFVFMIIIYVLYNSTSLIEQINSMDYAQVGTGVLILYIVFVVLYLFITMLVFTIRYNKAHIQLRKYGEHIKKINKMYERDEKLRQ